MRFVLDTNTTISGLFWLGAPHLLLEVAKRQLFTPYTCPELLTELFNVIRRPKFASKLAATGRHPKGVIAELLSISVQVALPATIPQVCRDANDDIVLACAVSAHADAIVSGDRDLQVLKYYQTIPILSAAEALLLLPSP